MTVPLAPINGEVIPPGDGITVILAPHPLKTARLIRVLPIGTSISDAVRVMTGDDRRWRYRAYIGAGEHVVPEAIWARVKPKVGTTLVIHAVAGKDSLKSLALIAVAVAAFFLAPVVAGAFFTAGTVGFSVVSGLAGAAITMGGSYLISKLFPTRPEQLSDGSGRPVATLTGARNVAEPFGTISVILGRTRVYPKLGAQTITEVTGGEQYLRMLVVWGYGRLNITDLKIGDTPILTYDPDVEIETVYGRPTDDGLTLFPKTPFERQLSIELDYQEQNIRVSEADVDELTIDLTAPQGLYTQKKKDGVRSARTVNIRVDYRPFPGGGGWTLWQTVAFTGNTVDLKRKGIRKRVSRGQYEVRVTRQTSLYTGDDNVVVEAVYWTALRSFRNDPPVNFPEPLAMTALRIKAGKLSGVIDDLNGVCTSLVRSWDGAEWQANTPSSNPADLFRAVLQHPANARPVPNNLIDLDTLAEWAEYCASEGFEFNQERAGRTSVYETLADIAAAGRAVPIFVDGKWSVAWDRPDDPIVWHFTPRNSSGFKGSRTYAPKPHAWRVRFQNENKGFREDERIVYDDGYSAANATRFEAIEFPGVTHPRLVWRHGRFHIAQARLRPEIYETTADFEHLRLTRGNRVRVTHDVSLIGLVSGRVKAVDGSIIALDEVVIMQAGVDYGIRFRLPDGTSLLRAVETVAGETMEVTLAGSGDVPSAGCLFAFGEYERESAVMRVLSIEPLEDLQARIRLVDDAPEISEADHGTIPEFDSQITVPPDPFTLPPVALRATEFFSAISGGVRGGVYLSWTIPRFGQADRFETQFRQSGVSDWDAGPTAAVPQTHARIYDLEAGSYDFRVRTVFNDGKVSAWETLSAFPLDGLSREPPNVTVFRMALTGDTATLHWIAPESINIKGYEIRFAPVTEGASWSGAVALFDDLIPGTSVTIVPVQGTYLIKAVSFQGAQSLSAAALVNGASAASNFNVVEVVEESADDDPAFPGDHDGTVYDSTAGGLRLASPAVDFFAPDDFFDPPDMFLGYGVAGTGRYQLAETKDLGEVFTSRVTAALTVSGVDLLDNIFDRLNIFSITNVFGDDPTVWSAHAELRYTLDDPGGSPVWSEWERFVAGDYTARAFQFLTELTSTHFSITPVVTRAKVTIDMPDRVVAGNDLVVTTSGRSVAFDPAFRSLQGLAIVAQDLATGDYAVVSNKDEEGFDIIFRNSAGSPVERTFDFVAKGYGRVIS
ncbi:MAG: hypothetical protein KIS96_11705 [Bauldia sp.]|nr:hypothetical protein [Bauldia sp.]